MIASQLVDSKGVRDLHPIHIGTVVLPYWYFHNVPDHPYECSHRLGVRWDRARSGSVRKYEADALAIRIRGGFWMRGFQVLETVREFARIKDELLRRSPEENIFKSLYESTEKELKETQKKLELTRYQVGRLEAQMRGMVPQIEYKKEHQSVMKLEAKNRSQGEHISHLKRQVRLEQFVKKVYFVFFVVMVGLVPLLLLLRFFQS